MNNRVLKFIKNFSYTLSSNMIGLLISTLVVLIVPKLITLQDYGYWQLYLFYASYVGFFHFGWNDGIYLRYGGKEYKDLDKGLFFSQFWMLAIMQVSLAAIATLASIFFVKDTDRLFICTMVVLCMIVMGTRGMLLFVLQATNRIKEYAQITIVEKILYCCLIMVLLLMGVRQYKLLIVADLVGKILSLIYSVYCCKDIVLRSVKSFYFNIREAVENVNVGIKLMFANIASMMIIGVVRYGIERAWNVETFGKVSLTMSISSLMMLFVNAVGVIMFPILRRMDDRRLAGIYSIMRNFLMVPLLGLLVFYYPLKVVLSAWLPQYAESLNFMALLFCMCVYEGKMVLLVNTYLKTLRKEKLMLVVNLASLILSVFTTIAFTIVFKSLPLAVVSIVFLLAFRCVLAEAFLAKTLSISVYKDIILEIGMTGVFILTGWFVGSWQGVVIYLMAYGLYLLIKREDIVSTIKDAKALAKA